MKNHFKLAVFLFIGLFLVRCNSSPSDSLSNQNQWPVGEETFVSVVFFSNELLVVLFALVGLAIALAIWWWRKRK